MVREEAAPYGKPQLLDQLRQALRTRHYCPKTETAYVIWGRRFIFYPNVRYRKKSRGSGRGRESEEAGSETRVLFSYGSVKALLGWNEIYDPISNWNYRCYT